MRLAIVAKLNIFFPLHLKMLKMIYILISTYKVVVVV